MLACLVDCAMPLRFLEKETSRKNGGNTSCGDAGSGAAPAVWMVATGGLGGAGPRPGAGPPAAARRRRAAVAYVRGSAGRQSFDSYFTVDA